MGHDGEAEETSDEHEEEVIEVRDGSLDGVVDDGQPWLEAIELEAAEEGPASVKLSGTEIEQGKKRRGGERRGEERGESRGEQSRAEQITREC